jgi:pyridinium-3,5-biscarboxylic acid mononucleotide sulfurtransferase
MTLEEKGSRLGEILRGYGRVAVALSGGVDSSYLCAAAREELGEGAIAITVVSPMLPKSELADAREIAALLGMRHVFVDAREIEEDVATNPPDRCYHCKKRGFGAIALAAREEGIGVVLDGTNADDEGDYRPGMRAIVELGVASPLRLARLTKADIRELSRRAGLPTWDKSAASCLASRIPYGERIDAAKLARIEEAETFLRGMGFAQLRVRCHGDLARIEAAPAERAKLCDTEIMDRVAGKLRELGFLYVCMDLEGYSMGSLNRALAIEGEGKPR